MTGTAHHGDRHLRVAIPAELLRRNPPTRGAGRIYHGVLPHLARMSDLTVRESQQRFRGWWRGRVDVWIDGAHSGPVRRRQPTVAVAHGGEFLTHPEAFPGTPAEYFEAIRVKTL